MVFNVIRTNFYLLKQPFHQLGQDDVIIEHHLSFSKALFILVQMFLYLDAQPIQKYILTKS